MADSPNKRDEARTEGNKRGAKPRPSPRGWSFREATLKLPIKPSEHVRLVWQFFIALALIALIFVTMLYVLVFRLDKELVVNQIKEDTAELASAVRVAWDWNLSHGGVYVLEGPPPAGDSSAGSETKRYTFVNHAAMLGEMSEIAARTGKFKGHLIGMKADTSRPPSGAWETAETGKWRTGNVETASALLSPDGQPVYRTLIPLVADAACLQCHRHEGFKPGEAIGAFSLEVPLTAAYAAIRSTKLTTAFLYGLSLLVLLFVISLLVLRLSSQLKAAYYHIEQTAREDYLTGLPNRRAFREFADMQVALSRRHGWPLTLLMMDIDDFKRINDAYGHPKGDEALKVFSRVIRENIRRSDVPCRWGGEEFIVLLVNTPAKNSTTVWTRLRDLFGGIKVEGVPETLTVSFGVSQLRSDETLLELIERADHAMLAGKRAGGDTIMFAPGDGGSSEAAPTDSPAGA